MGYYYDAMREYGEITGQCRCFIYLNINCVIIEYREYYQQLSKSNKEYTLQLANAILNIIPTKYNIQFIDRHKTSAKLLEVDTKEFLACLNIFIEAGFSIRHDDYNNNVECIRSVRKKGEVNRVIKKLNESRFPEEKLVVKSIKDLY